MQYYTPEIILKNIAAVIQTTFHPITKPKNIMTLPPGQNRLLEQIKFEISNLSKKEEILNQIGVT